MSEAFDCDYCGGTFPKSELHYSLEQDTYYQQTVGTFGGNIIEGNSKQYMTKMCSRCNKFHTMADCLHIVLGLLCIGVAIYIPWKEGKSFSIENYLWPASIGFCVAYLISRIDWLFITLFFGVRRKPKK